MDKTKLLFLHRTATFWYITFHSSTLQLFLKLLLSYYETTISERERTIGSYTNKKVLLSRDSPCFFPAFLLFDESFFLKIARTARHGFPVRNYFTGFIYEPHDQHAP